MKNLPPQDELNQVLRRVLLFWIVYSVILTFLYWVTRGNPMPKIEGLVMIGLYLSINTANPK